MDLRPYLPTDCAACLAIFDSILAAGPLPFDRATYESFLASPAGPYFVTEHNGDIIGCGGYAVSTDPAVARLTWGMIRPDLQRQGQGRYLLMYRLREIGKLHGISTVLVTTSPQTAPFFEGQGFKRVRAAGDHIELTKRLTVCA